MMPITPRQTTRAMTPITTRRRATMCAARVRDTDLSLRHRLWRLSGLDSEGPTVDQTVSVHDPVAISPLTRPCAVEEDAGHHPESVVVHRWLPAQAPAYYYYTAADDSAYGYDDSTYGYDDSAYAYGSDDAYGHAQCTNQIVAARPRHC